jgi:hypothetical protein
MRSILGLASAALVVVFGLGVITLEGLTAASAPASAEEWAPPDPC